MCVQEPLEESQDSGCGSGNDTQVGIMYCTVLYCTILYCTVLYCNDTQVGPVNVTTSSAGAHATRH